MTYWIRRHRHLNPPELLRQLNWKLRGHYNYYGVRGNAHRLKQFYEAVRTLLHKWLNRRGPRRSYTWVGFKELLKQFPLACPRLRRQQWRKT